MSWLNSPGDRDIREYSPAVLAYLGDAVLELFIRTWVAAKGNRPVRELHRMTVEMVKAENQAKTAKRLEGLLTPEEAAVLRRGRNWRGASSGGAEHRLSTGLEAVLGYLFLQGDDRRLSEVLNMIVEGEGNDESNPD